METLRRLHIGGKERREGWEILDAIPGAIVDHLGNAEDLSQFPDSTFVELYASHVLEHLDYARNLMPALKEWLRVLLPGGKAYISVPDLQVLCELFITPDLLSDDQKFEVMRMMFGGHVSPYDFHFTGFSEEILGAFLHHAGFVNMQRVDSFGLFDDTSCGMVAGRYISINVVAEKAPVVQGTFE